MSYRGLCRIPGKTGVFDIVYERNKIMSLKPVLPSNVTLNEIPWICAGLFDIQINGMVGVHLSDAELTEEGVLKVSAALEEHGVLQWCPTIISSETEIVEKCLEVIGGLIEKHEVPNIYGIHLEGHYISPEPGYRGIHLEKYLRDPDEEEIERWQKAAKGNICLFSLAPERNGAINFISKLKAMGIKVGLVHHNADYETICAAAAAGADISSHLLNGCKKYIHRQRNIIWSQLSLKELWASFIADGYHIPHYTLRALINSKGISRSMLISDLSHLSGLPDGEYNAYGNEVVLKNGGLWVKGEGTDLLSGAAKTLDKNCAYVVDQVGFSMEQALIMASLNPARYFGIENQMMLYPGWKGKLVKIFRENGSLQTKKI